MSLLYYCLLIMYFTCQLRCILLQEAGIEHTQHKFELTQLEITQSFQDLF